MIPMLERAKAFYALDRLASVIDAPWVTVLIAFHFANINMFIVSSVFNLCLHFPIH
jgi:hypothetical protein